MKKEKKEKTIVAVSSETQSKKIENPSQNFVQRTHEWSIGRRQVEVDGGGRSDGRRNKENLTNKIKKKKKQKKIAKQREKIYGEICLLNWMKTQGGGNDENSNNRISDWIIKMEKTERKKKKTGKNRILQPQSLLSRRRRASVLIIINTVTVSCYIGEIKIKSRSSNMDGFIRRISCEFHRARLINSHTFVFFPPFFFPFRRHTRPRTSKRTNERTNEWNKGSPPPSTPSEVCDSIVVVPLERYYFYAISSSLVKTFRQVCFLILCINPSVTMFFKERKGKGKKKEIRKSRHRARKLA